MAGMNTNRIIIGGLIAGLVFAVLDMVLNMTLMAADMQALAEARNLDLAALERGSTIATFVLCDFLFGILAVWTYAAIRPRFGPGARTAVSAALIVYLAAMFAVFGFTVMGLFPIALFLKSAVAYLVVSVAATMAGAFVYKEA